MTSETKVYRIYTGPVTVREVAVRIGGVPGTEHVYVEAAGPASVRESFRANGLQAPTENEIREWPRMPAILGSL